MNYIQEAVEADRKVAYKVVDKSENRLVAQAIANEQIKLAKEENQESAFDDAYVNKIVKQSEKYMDDPNSVAAYVSKMEQISGHTDKALKDFHKDTRTSLITDLAHNETVQDKVAKAKAEAKGKTSGAS